MTFTQLREGDCFTRITARSYRDHRLYVKEGGAAVVRGSNLHVGLRPDAPVAKHRCDYRPLVRSR